jgi:HAMP domain-containing protein
MDNSRQRLGSIRNRILIFSLLVTLVPSIGMGWFWYDLSSKTTTDKIAQKLATSADIIEREIGLWFKERNYDLRVLANSFVIAENLAFYQQAVKSGTTAENGTAEALKKISTYLSIIITKFTNYHHLSVLDAGGKVLAASRPLNQEKFMALPANWSEQVKRNQHFIGEYIFAAPDGDPLVLMGIPLLEGGSDQVVGFFVLEARLDTIKSLFVSSLADSGMKAGSAITLLERDGRIIARTTANPDTEPTDMVTSEALQLLEQPAVLREYVDGGQEAVLAMAFPFDHLPWCLLLEENKNRVYAGLMEARDQILLISALLTIVIGGTAIIISRHIIIPLQELTTGVQQVAGGDLQVSIPVHRKDELGLVATTFNDMVQRIKESQARLEELAITDRLPGSPTASRSWRNLSCRWMATAGMAPVLVC